MALPPGVSVAPPPLYLVQGAGVALCVQGGEEGRLDWPAARKAIDSAMERARREIRIVVSEALGELPIADGKRAADAILAQVKDDDDD